MLDPTGLAYHRFAEDHYGKPVDLEAVRQVFAWTPLSPSLVRRLNAERSTADLLADLAYIGYPRLLA
ncbi:hypothetical protein Ait01nite_097450 [Actinoplanes italicus]|uniref:Uncharacterized protein n=1 Tax=Actinoplanes italicus TaxID=113567 RepID=A0A2T0JLE1_9ACTN|nr:hypothetical protein [Actinoplanes italicus]PRX08416.1 hypothetical protein CLV67_14015 [Actinoplanes italicus]GIE36700.1 hypothetical protein Ait01nite_097450 [Actinoplanes italicus]